MKAGLEGVFNIGTRDFIWKANVIDARTREDRPQNRSGP